MRRHSLCLFSFVFACSAPEVNTAESNARARAVVDSVLAATGGMESLRGIQTLAVQMTLTDFRVPADSAPHRSTVVQARDFATGRNMYETKSDDAARPDWQRVVMTPAGTFTHDFLTGETRALGTNVREMAGFSELQLQWYVHQAVLTAQLNASNLTWTGDTLIDGIAHDVIQFDEGPRQVTLYVSTDNHLVSRRVAFVPQTGNTTDIRYSDYWLVSGVPFPHSISIHSRAGIVEQYDVLGIVINAELTEDSFLVPAGNTVP